MINHVWSVLCSSMAIDRETNLVSLFNVIEEFTINTEPQPDWVLPVEFELISLWVRVNPAEPSRGKSRLTFIKPSGDIIQLQETDLDLTKFERLRSRGRFRGLPVTESGIYKFKVELFQEMDNESLPVAEIPLKITFVKPGE